MPMAEYVGGKLCQGSDFPYALGRSNLKTIVTLSPLHAKRDIESTEDDNTRASDLGTVCHDLALEKNDRIVWIDAKNYQTKKAQELRDEAYELGKMPLLKREEKKVNGMVKAIRAELEKFGKLQVEHTLLWRDPVTQLVCKSRLDALACDMGTIIDVKTTKSASPESYKKIIYKQWHDVQMAHGAAGIAELTGIAPAEWVWIVCEDEEPFCTTPIYASEAAIETGARRRVLGLNRWRKCIDTDEWPGYDRQSYLTPPDWVTESLAREESAA